MTDEEATLNEDSAETGTTEEVDYQKRYTDTQSAYTKAQQALREQESVWEDEQRLLARIGEKFPHLLADEEDADEDVDEDDDESPDFMTKSEFKAWQDEQTAKADQQARNQQYETDIKKFVGERELSKFGRNAIDAMALRGEIKTPEQLEAAVQEWFAYEDSRATAPKKKAPHVLPGGKANTGVKPFHEMTRQEREDYMVERAQGLASQT